MFKKLDFDLSNLKNPIELEIFKSSVFMKLRLEQLKIHPSQTSLIKLKEILIKNKVGTACSNAFDEGCRNLLGPDTKTIMK
jgi:hypothetical protein